MNSYDFVLEWQNIEYALNEAEDILLAEVTTEKVFRPGAVTKGVTYATMGVPVVTTKAAKAVAGSVAGGVQNIAQNGVSSKYGLLATAGKVKRSRLMNVYFWQKLVQRIKELWQRFHNIISSLFKSHSKFADTELYNAEAIIRNAMADKRMGNTVKELRFEEIYPFWTTNALQRIQIPRLNTGDARMMDSLDEKNLFVSRYIRELGTGFDFNDGNCVTQLKQLFRGSSQPISAGLDDIAPYVKNMVAFCRGKEQLVHMLQTEHHNITNSAHEAERMLNSSGLRNEDAFSNSAGDSEESRIARDTVRIRNYISIAQTILGVKQTIVQEYFLQSVQILRKAMFHLNAVTKGEIENARMNHYVSETEPQEEEETKQRSSSRFGTWRSRADATKKLAAKSDANKTELSVSSEYMNSLPNDIKALRKEAEKINMEKERLTKFINKRKLRADDPRFEEIYKVIQDYDKRLAVLNAKAQQVPHED